MLPIWISFDLGSLDPGKRHANDVESSALANCYVINNSQSQTGTAGIRKDHYHKVKYVPVRRSLLKFWNQASSVTASVFLLSGSLHRTANIHRLARDICNRIKGINIRVCVNVQF